MDNLFRFAENDLLAWYNKARRKPIVLRGARQVGKSTLVREFARRNALSLCEINLERYLYLDDIFKTLDPDKIIGELEAVIGKTIGGEGTLLFLDEIQAVPYALQALRYFYEDRPEIAVIAAGSLLEFTLADHNFSMPVGRIQYYHLGPMTFKEYIYAFDRKLFDYFEKINLEESLPQTIHQKLLDRQREYFFVGGMPEAVAAFKSSSSILEVTDVHRSIADTYLDDFAKYAKHKELALLQKVFRAIPRLIGQKIKYTNISREDKSKDIKNAIALLTRARIIIPIIHSHCSGIPLNSDIDESMYKLIFMDIGLVNHLCGMDWQTISTLDSTRLINEGPLAEQFIGQHLLYSDRGISPGQLTYWIREGKSSNAEVDYVTSVGTRIVPIEVKAGKSGTLKSLQQFVLQKKITNTVRFDLNEVNLQTIEHTVPTAHVSQNITFKLLSLPLYAVEELKRLVTTL